MTRFFLRAVALVGLLAGSVAFAQQPAGPTMPQPRITSAFPPGAKSGTTVEVTVTGSDMDGEEPELIFADRRITAEYVAPPVKDEKKKDEKKKDAPATGKKKMAAAPTGSVKFKVTVPAEVPAGGYDVRLSNSWGVSNPRLFTVGTLPEVDEKEPNNDVPEAQVIALGTVINGTISSATDVDYVRFTGKKSQRVLAHCATTSIDGKARPQVELYTPAGQSLAVNRNYQGNDALLDAVLPGDGEYLIRLSEFAYQAGGPDAFYRLTLSTGPWVDAVFPPAVAPGGQSNVTVYGRNLPGGKPVAGAKPALESVAATVTPPTDRNSLLFPGRVPPPMGVEDGFTYRLSPTANAVPLFLVKGPVVPETDKPNDTPPTAQEVSAPCNVAGRIEKSQDRDFYKFTAKKGDVFWVELFADRLGMNADLYFAVRTEANADVSGEQDDDQDALHPTAFFTRSGDPAAYKFTAPADGKYLVMVGSREATVTYGPRVEYVLRIGSPTPDFRAVVMPRSRDNPAGVVLTGEGEVALDVFIHRRDGFNGPVILIAENLPEGVTAAPAVVGTGARWGSLVLSAEEGAEAFTGPIVVKCLATIDDKSVIRTARPASITWAVPPPGNAPAIARLDQQLLLAVRPALRAPFRLLADRDAAKVKTKDKAGKETEQPASKELVVKPGDKITLPVKVIWQEKDVRPNPINLVMEQTLPGAPNAGPVTVANVTVPKDKTEATVVIDVKPSTPPGTYGVVIRGDTQVPFVRDPAMKDKKTPTTAAAYTVPVVVTVK